MEIGKKYPYKGFPVIYTVIYEHPTGEVVVIYNDKTYSGWHSRTIHKVDFKCYEEYFEPVVHTWHLTWLKNKNTKKIHAACSSHLNATYHNDYFILNRDTVTYTEYK